MIEFLKSLPTLGNLFFLWLLLYFFLRFKKHRYRNFVLISGLLALLICTTSYLPKLAVTHIEKQYAVLAPSKLNPNKTYYIHVLGAGYNLDPDLPALTQLENSTLARLNEGIRVFWQLKEPVLVTSAYSKYNLESQASVARKAAIELGVPAERIRMLETPSTTLEEAKAFKSKFGADAQVIIATDAMHMPRAMQIYRDLGFEPIAAPTNFQVHFGPKASNGLTWPNYHSFKLSNRYFRAQLKQLYYWMLS